MNDMLPAPRTSRPAGAWLAIVAVAALGVGLIAGPALAAATAPRAYSPIAAAPGDPAKPEHTISVGGSGKVTVTPDIATVRLGVLVQRPTAKAAREDAAAAMTGLVDALRKLGIADKDIATSLVSLSPVYDYSNTGAAPKITGYQLSNSVSVTVRDLTNLSDVLDQGITSGANTVDGISFDVADRAAAESKAREAAIADARAKADTYAKGLNISITGVASVTESVSTPVWYQPNYATGAAPADKGSTTPVLPGSTDVVIAVQVAFLIP
jgi:uncharacterized protein YggE